MLLVSSLSTTENNGLQVSPKLAKLFIDQITEYQNYHNIVVVSMMQFWPYCFSYGDKVPRTMYGRLFSVVWILTGVCLISIFTAAITSAITVSSVDPGCKSTQGKRVSNVFLPLLQLKIIWLIVSAAVFLTTYASWLAGEEQLKVPLWSVSYFPRHCPNHQHVITTPVAIFRVAGLSQRKSCRFFNSGFVLLEWWGAPRELRGGGGG